MFTPAVYLQDHGDSKNGKYDLPRSIKILKIETNWKVKDIDEIDMWNSLKDYLF